MPAAASKFWPAGRIIIPRWSITQNFGWNNHQHYTTGPEEKALVRLVCTQRNNNFVALCVDGAGYCPKRQVLYSFMTMIIWSGYIRLCISYYSGYDDVVVSVTCVTENKPADEEMCLHHAAIPGKKVLPCTVIK